MAVPDSVTSGSEDDLCRWRLRETLGQARHVGALQSQSSAIAGSRTRPRTRATPTTSTLPRALRLRPGPHEVTLVSLQSRECIGRFPDPSTHEVRGTVGL